MTDEPRDPPRLRGDPDGPASLREGLQKLGESEIPDAARTRLAVGLGLGPPPAPSGGGSAGGLSVAAKVGMGLSVLVGAAAIWLATRQEPPPAAPVGFDTPVVQPSVVPTTPTVASARPLTSVETPPASATVAPTHVAPASTVSAQVQQPDEATLFRNAGTALRSGDPTHALQLVDEQARRFPDGTFAQEREVLRIDALVALNRNDEARDRARAFLAEHPESAHRPRLERMLAK